MDIPNSIGGAGVVCYTLTKYNSLNTYGLAICKYDSEDGFYLFSCNSEWKDFSDTWHQTIEDAIDQAEYEYQIKDDAWVYTSFGLTGI